MTDYHFVEVRTIPLQYVQYPLTLLLMRVVYGDRGSRLFLRPCRSLQGLDLVRLQRVRTAHLSNYSFLTQFT